MVKKNKINIKNKNVPSEIKVVSTLFVIYAIYTPIRQIIEFYKINLLQTSYAIFDLSISIIISIYLIINAIYLVKLRNWSRISAIILCILGIIITTITIVTLSLLVPISQLVTYDRIIIAVKFLIYLLVVVYLLFNKKVKGTFK